MLTVGTCRICETGPLGLRRCGSCERLVILCNECDAAWISADLQAQPVYADEETMPCPHCSESLWDLPSQWATEEEISATSWINEAITAGELALQQKEDELLDPEAGLEVGKPEEEDAPSSDIATDSNAEE